MALRRSTILFAVFTLAAVTSYGFFRKRNITSDYAYDHEHDTQRDRIPLIVNAPVPPGACDTYSELRDINFLHKSIRHSICSGVPAYTIFDSAFPICELQKQLPELLKSSVKSASFQSYIWSPVTLRNLSCFVYKNSDLISDSIKTSHIFEKANVKTMTKLVQHFNALSPVTFLDIGSNIGVFTLAALDIGVPVVALDANIRNLIRIQLSVELNQTNRLRLLWNFISSQVSLMYLNFPENCNIGGATKFGRAVTDTIPVMSTTADSIATVLDTRTILIKVDIEGGEAAFFKTAAKLFDAFIIPVVHMEWLERHMTEDERKFIIEFFTKRRYTPRSMNNFNTPMNIKDPKLTCDDLVWIRGDFLENLLTHNF